MRIDIHSHVIPARIVDQIESNPTEFAARVEGKAEARKVIHEQGYVYPLFAEFHDPEAKLESMDRKGIDVSVISPAPPMFYYWADVDLALKTARLVNDGVADMVAAKPSRLRGMATIPMQHPDAASPRWSGLSVHTASRRSRSAPRSRVCSWPKRSSGLCFAMPSSSGSSCSRIRTTSVRRAASSRTT